MNTRSQAEEELRIAVGSGLDLVKNFEERPDNWRLTKAYPEILLLTESYEEAKREGWKSQETKLKGARFGFARWFYDVSECLGAKFCNELGLRMCEKAGFTAKKGRRILAALKEAYLETVEREGREMRVR